MKQLIRITTLIFLASLGVVIANTSPTYAADARNYRAGRIIDDVVFTNSDSMTVAQIQAFLDSKMPNCDTNGDLLNNRAWMQANYGINPPYRCVNTYRENPDTGANNYGTSVNPAGSLSSAELIYRYSKQFSINPQVLIVTLQKENGLITDRFPIPRQFQQAMGFGCPDNVPPGQPACDPTYNSFSNQLYQAARHFRGYINRTPGWTITFNTGWQDVLWSTNSACGTGPVYIENQATAALYTYTPYQPNTAALNAQYGLGDGCSQYGNRNFYLYFTDWFGPTISSLIKSPDGGIYLLENGKKRAFPNELIFASYRYRFADAIPVSATAFASIPDGPVMTYNPVYREGRLVSAPSQGVFLVENGTKRPFPNEATFAALTYSVTNILPISAYELSLIPDGTAMQYNVHTRDGILVRSSFGGMFVVENGTKRPFPNEATFLSYKYTWRDALLIPGAELSLIPEGTPMPYNVNFRNGILVKTSAGGIYVVDSGTKRPFPNEETYLSYKYTWADALAISSVEVSLIPEGTPMPYNVNFRNGILVKTSAGGIYVVDSGTKRPFPNEETYLSYGYEWSDALTISAKEMSMIPDGTPMPMKAS